MRAVIQRVARASVSVEGNIVGQIESGLMVLVGAAEGDSEADAKALALKVATLRIFPDTGGKMNLDVQQAGGRILAISQFTLLGDCRKGRRPSFVKAGRPEPAKLRYDEYVRETRALGLHVETGVFQADMQVELINDGPVTLLLDTEKTF
jgi:D-aminoacyl-tRNA deacylase